MGLDELRTADGSAAARGALAILTASVAGMDITDLIGEQIDLELTLAMLAGIASGLVRALDETLDGSGQLILAGIGAKFEEYA